jgi:sigma-B regulation protein RsbU (phosphoserine phosphatase)
MNVGQNQVRIFVCDDQMEVREALRLLLKSNGCVVETFAAPEDLLAAAARRPANVILLDMNYTRDTTSGDEGLDLIARLRELRTPAALIAMTAWGDIGLAVEAMRRGASDFVEKPWNNDRLLLTVQKWSNAQPAESKDLAGARRVQQQLLPRQSAPHASVDFACRFLPAREVSGDYYDFFEKRPGHFGFVVADVSGKGVPAAMLMSNLQALFRSHTYLDQGPAAVLRAVNRQFHESTSPESFATAFYADLDESSSEMTFINCGHPPALLRRSSGDIQTLDAGSMVLGAFPFWEPSVGRVRLEPGDRLLVYSDGAVEAQSASGEEFGEDRLLRVFQSTAAAAPNDSLAAVENAIQSHSGVSLFDDCTLFLAAVR